MTGKKCRSCQKEIDPKATKCPYCQSKQGNWFSRHPILTIVIVLFTIGMITAGNNSNKNDQTSSQTSQLKKQSNPTPVDLMKQNNPDIKHITTLTADYVGTSFTLYAYAKTSDYYNYGFSDEKSYYSIRLRDSSVDNIFDHVYGYISKANPENRELIEKMLNQEVFLKVNASIPTNKYRESSNAFLQIESWEEIK